MSHHGDNLSPDPDASDREPLIDSLLDEKLGGISPPDLTQKILARLDEENSSRQDTLVSTRRTSHARQYKSVRSKGWTSRLIVAATLSMMAGVVGFIVWSAMPNNDHIAKVEQPIADPAGGESPSGTVLAETDRGPGPEHIAVDESDGSPNETDVVDAVADSTAPDSLTENADRVAGIDYFDNSKYDRAGQPSSQGVVLEFLRSEFHELWREQNVTPAQYASDKAWLTRTFDRLIGRSPSADEVEAFTRSRAVDKRATIVASITKSETYKSEFDSHWAKVLKAQLGEVAATDSIVDAVQQDLPYDQLLQRSVAAAETDLDSVCQNVLGARMDCAKCHSERGLNANRLEQFADGFKNHREQFSQAVARSDKASEVLVNKVWAHFFSAPLTPQYAVSANGVTPILRPAVERLTQEFISNGYDTKNLATWLVLSEPFKLSDERTAENEVDSAIALQPLFARHYSNKGFATSIAHSLNKFASADVDLIGQDATPDKVIASLEPRLKDKSDIESDKIAWEDIAFMNSDPDRANILEQHGPYLKRLAGAKLRSHEKVEHVFLAALGRSPTPAEREPAIAIVRSKRSNPILGLRNVWWAISKGR